MDPKLSRPGTPSGLSPRGSYVNLLLAGKESPIAPMDEKDRLRAEAELRDRAQADLAERAKKDEGAMPAGSPGSSLSSLSCPGLGERAASARPS